jgi:hypothetical protein
LKTILYTVAKSINGEFIKANDAEKGGDFFCPVCDSKLLLRKSGNTSKNSKRPHFAHKSLTPNCTPETALHFSFKNLLAQKLQHDINNSLLLTITWNCKYCTEKHAGNLLKKVAHLKVEHDLGACQPDIALLDNDNKVIAVVEVVVTHKPEKQVIDFYQRNNIILIQLNLTSDNDLNEIENKISNPDFVSFCFNPKCRVCERFLQKKKMTIIDGPCWKCGNTMKIATVSSGNGGYIRGLNSNLSPNEFTTDEVAFARDKGVILKEQFSKTTNDKYLANSCIKCGAFAGNFYLFPHYIAPAGYGQLPSETFDIGYHCERCDG